MRKWNVRGGKVARKAVSACLSRFARAKNNVSPKCQRHIIKTTSSRQISITSQPVRIYIVVLSWYYDNSHESHASAEVKEIRGRTSTHLQLCSYGLCSRPTRDVWCRTECGSNSPPLPRAVGIISFGYSYLSRFPSLQLMGGVNIPLSFSRPFL
jgi:hypothetical protein